jgi:hypothetical protein
MKPYGVISDTHHHNWSAFATTLESGINSRLQQILDETVRCADEVLAAGGNTIYHGGDLFHVRGSIAPSVLNPTMDCYRSILARGLRIVINAGNHDLEGKDANRLGSAITALEGIGCSVVNAPNYGTYDDMVIIPWIASIAKLKEAIEYVAPADRPGCDLLLHAPLDDVIPGIPDHGLEPSYLAGLGFRRVFCGHYHHHAEPAPNVFSIGSLTGQTWSDIGAKAGFLLVTETEVNWRASRAPSFVEVGAGDDGDDIPLIADGNYVRAKINSNKQSDIEGLRGYLESCGAKGVVVLPVAAAAPVARTGASIIKAGAAVEESIGAFIAAKAFANPAPLNALCADILTTARSAE